MQPKTRSEQLSSQLKANILLVDDQPANLLVLRSVLEDLDENLVEAKSGEEAVRRSEETDFAVVLLDVQMPGMDGFEAAKLIRASDKSRQTPIIFLTAYEDDRFPVEHAYSLGAVDFLTKPVVPVVLKAKVVGFVELYKEKERAKRAASQLRLLIEGTTEYAIFMLDPNGHIMTWNPGAERIKGYRADEIIGKHFSCFYPAEANERSFPEHELKVARATGRFEDEGWRVRKDGTQFWANVVITALYDDAGNLQGFSKITRDMTERKQADENARRLLQEEAARKHAEELARVIQEQRGQLQITLASIGDAVISTDAEGLVTFVNPVAERLTGWTQQESQRKPLLDIFKIVNEQSRQPVENPALRALTEGMIVGLANHTILIARDGTERPIDDSAAPIRGENGAILGVVLVFRDVTERRRADNALRASEARKTAILETALDCIISMDHEGMIVEFNPASEKIFGYRREHVIGKELAEVIIPPSLRDRHRRGMAHYLATGEGPVLNQRLELSALHADGTEFPVELAITRISTGGPPQFTAYLRDISERVRQECHRSARLAVTQLLAQAATVQDAARGILQAICENLGWDLGFYWKLERESETLRCFESWHKTGVTITEFEQISRTCTFARGEGLPGRLWETGKPAWILDVVRDTNFPRVAPAAKESLHSAFGCPIVVAGETLGVIEFFCQRIRETDADLLEMMDTIAGQFGQFLERKVAEAKLREQEHQARTILESITDAFCALDRDWRYVYVNHQAEVLMGRNRTDLLGKSHWDVYSDTLGTDLERNFRHAMNEKVTVTFEFYYPPKDRWYEVHAYPSSDGMSVYFRDASDRRRAEAAVRASEEKLRLLADTIPQLAWMARPDGHIFWYNRRWYEYTGTTPDQMEGWGWQSVHDPAVLPKVLEQWKGSLTSGEPFEMVFPLKGADEKFRPFLTRVNPLRDDQGQVLYWFGTNTDISEIKKMEEALRDADRRKDEFLATLAHELRNPLAPIRNSLQILKMPRVDVATAQQTRDMMERQVHHLVRLVDDLMDVSRVMRGKIELRKEQVELATVVARAVETAQPLIEVQGHRLQITLPQESLLLDADPVRLAQVVGNLLTNAAKYTEANGSIWVGAEREGNQAVLRVRDTGIGIGPDMLPHVFELFVQVDHAATRSQGGLGIGLTLVKNLVEMHQGTVQAHSKGLGRGSEFVVRLPLAPSAQDVSKSDEAQQPSLPTSGHRLLVVDDNADAADSLAVLLRLQGHEVRVAHNGLSALEIAAAYRPQMILLDIGMPGMDGYEVARRMRKQPGLEGVMLAALTGWGQQEDRRRSAEAGFDHHLVKPPEPKLLEALLADLKRAKS